MSAALSLCIDEDILVRLDRLAAERGMSRDDVVGLAVAGYLDSASDSLPPLADWQVEQIREGLDAAERGDFASDDDVDRLFAPHRL